MDSETRRRLAWSFFSNTVARLAQTIIQLIQVPVFLHFWSVPLYGEWIVLNSVPSYLAFSSTGFGTVAGNKMTMLVAGGNRDKAIGVFQSCWWLIVTLFSLITLVVSGLLYFLPTARLLKITHIAEMDTKWIIFYLAISVLLAQLEQLLQSAFRSIGRYPYGSFVKSMMALFAFTCTLVSVSLGYGARATALIYAGANIAGTIFLMILVKRQIDWIEFGWKHARFAEIRELAGPAIAYMGFPVGNALNLQGTLLAVSYALGPMSVVIFSTARTVSRIALQMVQMVSSTFEAELSLSYGAGKIDLTRALHRRSCQLALIASSIFVAGIVTVGPLFLKAWTGGHIPPSRGLMGILLLVVAVNSLWSASSTLISATNNHQRMAAVYLSATSVTCVACYFLARWYGIYGAAFALLVSELAMNFYVLPASLRIVHDTFPAFAASMLHYPAALKPGRVLVLLKSKGLFGRKAAS